jgi:hypothetical protein
MRAAPGVGFWQRPSRWVSVLFALSLALLAASLLTLREDLRFQSRPLNPAERHIVERALATWKRSGLDPGLLARLNPNCIRAMEQNSLTGPAERATFGYTNKRRRILLNPDLCFGVYTLLGSDRDVADLIPTLSTLYHEALHLLDRASEAEAYRGEWRFVSELRATTSNPRLRRELERWDKEMPSRVRECLGAAELRRIQASLAAVNTASRS